MKRLIGYDEFTAAVLLAASARGIVFHEEICGWSTPKLVGVGAQQERLSKFTAILPDTRLISVAQYHPHREALAKVCRALDPYLAQFPIVKSALNK